MLKTKALKQRFLSGSVSGPLIILVALAATALVIANQRTILDQVSVWQFHPSAAIAKLADESGMSDHGRFLYFASRPQINDRTEFNAMCRDVDSTNAVLGCYTDYHIYIFNVTDKRLDGIKATTAAHEMLHAAYARLSPGEKTRVDTMVEAAYKKLEKTDDLSQRVALYAKVEPGERDNELHSVLGTEIAKLPKNLDNYYKQYFSDRSKVVAEHAAYQAVFTKVQTQAETIQTEMASLQKSIESSSARYSTDVTQLGHDIQDFNNRANNGEFSSQSQFTAERSGLMARSSQLEADRQSINASIDRYNSLNKQLAGIAAQDQKLNQSINSQLPSTPSV